MPYHLKWISESSTIEIYYQKRKIATVTGEASWQVAGAFLLTLNKYQQCIMAAGDNINENL